LLKEAQFSSAATVALTASLGGVSMQATVKAEPASAVLQAISASTQQVRAGATFNLTVQLASPAPAGGAAVRWSGSSSSAVQTGAPVQRVNPGLFGVPDGDLPARIAAGDRGPDRRLTGC
jgi:hypothetical protein